MFTPTFTGLSARSHLFTPDIGLERHVADVVNVLGYEDLHGVIPLGHSYAGMFAGIGTEARERCDGLRWPPSEQLGSLGVGLNPTDEAWFRGTATPRPIKPLKDPAMLTTRERPRVPHALIRCTGEGSDLPPQVSGDHWRIYELPAGHWPMVTMPRELADILIAIAADA